MHYISPCMWPLSQQHFTLYLRLLAFRVAFACLAALRAVVAVAHSQMAAMSAIKNDLAVTHRYLELNRECNSEAAYQDIEKAQLAAALGKLTQAAALTLEQATELLVCVRGGPWAADGREQLVKAINGLVARKAGAPSFGEGPQHRMQTMLSPDAYLTQSVWKVLEKTKDQLCSHSVRAHRHGVSSSAPACSCRLRPGWGRQSVHVPAQPLLLLPGAALPVGENRAGSCRARACHECRAR